MALDDFGTGYSRPAYLWCLPLDTLKIDRGFIQDNAENSAVVGAVAALAHKLGPDIIPNGRHMVVRRRGHATRGAIAAIATTPLAH